MIDPSSENPDRPPNRSPRRNQAAQREYRIRQLTLDYAIGVSILGLVPLPGILTMKLILAGLLILKMLHDIGKDWGFPKGQDAFAVVGNLFGAIGAFGMALMAWVTMYAIGVVVPFLRGFGIAAALFTLTWALGQATYQFYASSPEPDDESPYPSRRSSPGDSSSPGDGSSPGDSSSPGDRV